MISKSNGVFNRYKYPVLTAGHVPFNWRYDVNPNTNRYMMERIQVNAVMNSGAIKWGSKYVLVVRVEGADRKSFLQWQRVRMALIISVFGTIRW